MLNPFPSPSNAVPVSYTYMFVQNTLSISPNSLLNISRSKPLLPVFRHTLMAPTSASSISIAMAEEEAWMFEIDVEKRKVNPRASDTVGGLIELHLTDSNPTSHLTDSNPTSNRQENISVFFTRTTLQNLDITETLFCAVLRQSHVLCWCQVQRIAISMLKYLNSKYVFTPEFLSGQGILRPCIRISLEAVFCSGGKGPDELDNLIILGRDLQRLVDSCGGEVLAAVAEEVVDRGAVIKRFRTSDLPSDCEDCAVCYERMQKHKFAIRTPCSHVFHDFCVEEWLYRRSVCCPMCRSVCVVSI